MKKNKYDRTKKPSRACDTDFSKFRSAMAKLDNEIAKRQAEKKKEADKKETADTPETEYTDEWGD